MLEPIQSKAVHPLCLNEARSIVNGNYWLRPTIVLSSAFHIGIWVVNSVAYTKARSSTGIRQRCDVLSRLPTPPVIFVDGSAKGWQRARMHKPDTC